MLLSHLSMLDIRPLTGQKISTSDMAYQKFKRYEVFKILIDLEPHQHAEQEITWMYITVKILDLT